MTNGLPLEKDFQRVVLEELRKIPRTWTTKLNDRTTIGLPDVLHFNSGAAFVFELKTNSKLSAIQAYTLSKIAQAGVTAIVLTPLNWPDVLAMLKARAKEKV